MEPNETNDCGGPRFPITIPKQLDAAQLRQIAELASSGRSAKKEVFYVVPGPGKDNLQIVKGTAGSPPSDSFFEIGTRTVEKRDYPDSILLICGEQHFQLAECFDAVFWTEAAVEKFVLPYYASLDMWGAAETLKAISEAWYGTVPQPSPPPLTGNVPGSENLVPIAIAHLPDSEWTTIPENPAAGVRLLVMHEGVLKSLSVREVLALRNGEKPREATDPAPRTPAGPDGA